jgi:parvulin-like peptidyl-prolyl isomerase
MKKALSIILTVLLAVGAGSVLAGCAPAAESSPSASLKTSASPVATGTGTVVGRVNGTDITVQDADLYLREILWESGLTLADVTDAEEMKSYNTEAVDMCATSRVILQKGTEMGFYPLSDADKAEADKYFTQFSSEVTPEFPEADLRRIIDETIVANALMNNVNKDLKVTQSDIQAKYDELLAAQKKAYTDDPAAIETDQANADFLLVYLPGGYRLVKHILIAMPEDIQTQMNSAADETELKKIRETGLPLIKAKADEALAKVMVGGDFDALIAEYGEDPGMQQEPTKSTGYPLSADSSFVPEFLSASMALLKVGDTTGLVATDYGYHIIKWVSGPGPIPLDKVQAALQSQLLATQKDALWQSTLDKWKEDAKIEQYPDKMPVNITAPSPTEPAETAPSDSASPSASATPAP